MQTSSWTITCGRTTLATLLAAGISLMAVAGCARERDEAGNEVESAKEAAEDAADKAEVEAAVQVFFAAWTKENGKPFTTDGLAKVIQTDEQFVSFDGMSQGATVISGWKDYSAIWGPAMNGFTQAKLSLQRTLLVVREDDLAVWAGLARIYGQMPGGQVIDMPAHVTLVLEQDNGVWKVGHEHLSLNVREKSK